METESLANNAARASEAFLDRRSQTMRTRLTYLCLKYPRIVYTDVHGFIGTI
jgi:hypothetical protein